MPNLAAAEQQPIQVESGKQSGATKLRLLSHNIQIGISSTRFRHYLTHSWKHVLPHPACFDNLNSIANMVCEFDIVALQEVDAGSFRSYFINQVEYLAKRGRFPYWSHQTNRNLGRIAQQSIGLLSKVPPKNITEHKLPGLIPGRGVMEVHFGSGDTPLILLLVHLALSRRARLRQIDYISEVVNSYEHVVVMGDFNCQCKSFEMSALLNKTELSEPIDILHTFPSWRPFRSIDHILTTPNIKVFDMQVLSHTISDHLPIAVDILVPGRVKIK